MCGSETAAGRAQQVLQEFDSSLRPRRPLRLRDRPIRPNAADKQAVRSMRRGSRAIPVVNDESISAGMAPRFLPRDVLDRLSAVSAGFLWIALSVRQAGAGSCSTGTRRKPIWPGRRPRTAITLIFSRADLSVSGASPQKRPNRCATGSRDDGSATEHPAEHDRRGRPRDFGLIEWHLACEASVIFGYKYLDRRATRQRSNSRM